VRPGRLGDQPAFLRLLEKEAREGRRETAPRRWMERALAGFDWEARSRVVEDAGGELDGAVAVTHRTYDIGTITRVEVAISSGGDLALRGRLVDWGMAFSRAAGAAAAQVWIPRGQGGALEETGLSMVRPWWRMDRDLSGELPPPQPVPGYNLLVGSAVAPGVWADLHNRTFADHWRYSTRTEEELMTGRLPALCLLAVEPHGTPAGITLGQLQSSEQDARAQPVGIVNSVGTLPEHRRHGLARWLVTEMLPRLRQAGARSASLYVDALNPTGAPLLYRDLGFEVAFETEVWEAVFP
jgi:ribosomal protein S18 acetylase RimI-like enzyme